MPPWQIVLIAAVALLGLAVLYLKLLSKGAAGEFAAALVMRFLGKKYRAFHNITFHDGQKTVQVDHLIVSAYGIFVVETKNYSGTVYGNENSDKFIQYLGKRKYEFYSPIKQNRGHIYSLSQVLGKQKFVSIILFSGRAKLKVDSQTFVGYIGQLNKYIKSFTEAVLTEQETETLCKEIKRISLKGHKVHKQHVQDIRERMQTFEEKVESRVCPKCGKNLVSRKGKYGEFLGCEGYPACKFKSAQ